MRMKAMNAVLALGLVVSAATSAARADNVYNNLSQTSAGDGGIYGESPADSFSTTVAGDLTDVQLLLRKTPGGANSSSLARVYLYSDGVNGPGSEIEQLGSTSSLPGSYSVVDISGFTPVALNASTRYWIELEAPSTHPQWSYDSSDAGTGVAGQYWYNTTLGEMPNSAGPYQMSVSITPSAVPEPGSLVLLGLAAAAISLRALASRRRGARGGPAA